MFRAALPYAITTLTVTIFYTIRAAIAATKSLLIARALLAALGAYTFAGVLITVWLARNVREFKEMIWDGICFGPMFWIAISIGCLKKFDEYS